MQEDITIFSCNEGVCDFFIESLTNVDKLFCVCTHFHCLEHMTSIFYTYTLNIITLQRLLSVSVEMTTAYITSPGCRMVVENPVKKT